MPALHTMTQPRTLWVVLPAYNEEDALPPLLQAYADVRANLPDLRVLVVDDGSADRTAEVVRQFAITHPWVEVLPHPHNMGLAAAMRTGLTTAVERAHDDDLIVTMDADNTHRPAEISAMVAKLDAERLDLVIASRFRPGAKMYGIPPERQLFSWTVSVLFGTVTPIRGVRDFSCGFRVYRAATLRKTIALWQDQFITERGFACMTEILYKYTALPGVRSGETPMILRYDQKPTATKMRVWQNIKDMFRLMWTHRLNAPKPPGQSS